jgi:hypothetical protein
MLKTVGAAVLEWPDHINEIYYIGVNGSSGGHGLKYIDK